MSHHEDDETKAKGTEPETGEPQGDTGGGAEPEGEDGDVAKLKEACPYLFRAQGPTGSTGAKPQGASSAIDDAIERGFRI